MFSFPIHPCFHSHTPNLQTVGQGQVHEPRHRGSHQTTEGGEGVDCGGATHQPLQDHSQRTTAKGNQTGPPVISHLYLQTLIVAILRSCCNSVLHSLYVCMQCCSSDQVVSYNPCYGVIKRSMHINFNPLHLMWPTLSNLHNYWSVNTALVFII